jgi:hypothetical protein
MRLLVTRVVCCNLVRHYLAAVWLGDLDLWDDRHVVEEYSFGEI